MEIRTKNLSLSNQGADRSESVSIPSVADGMGPHAWQAAPGAHGCCIW